jgi:hypothetical protein
MMTSSFSAANQCRLKPFKKSFWYAAALLLLSSMVVCGGGWAQEPALVPDQPPATFEPANAKLPTIWIVGDSTAAFHTPTNEGEAAAQGWGPFFAQYFDLNKVNVMNVARGGRSTRTYRS